MCHLAEDSSFTLAKLFAAEKDGFVAREPETYVACISFFVVVNPLLHSGELLCRGKVGLCCGEPEASILHSLASQSRSYFFSLANYFTIVNIFIHHEELVLQIAGSSSCLDFFPFLCLIFFQCLQNIKK